MWLLFEGDVYFIGKPADINHGWIRYIQVKQRRLLDAGIVHATSQFCCQPWKKSCTTPTALAIAQWPSSGLFALLCMSRVAAIQGQDHYGVCKTFVVAAAATVYREPHF